MAWEDWDERVGRGIQQGKWCQQREKMKIKGDAQWLGLGDSSESSLKQKLTPWPSWDCSLEREV